MYLCDYIKGGVIIGFTVLLMLVIKTSTSKVIALFVVAVISNIIAGIFTPASSALLPQIVKEESYQQAESYFSMLNSLQSIVGIILAGVLYTLVPINILFLIVGICYIISAISEMFIKYNSKFEKRNEKMTTKIIFSDIKEGFKYIFSLKALISLIICVLFFNFFISPIFENFGAYFIATDLASSDYLFKNHLQPEIWNSIYSVCFGMGSLIMGIVLSTLKSRDKYSGLIKFGLTMLTTCLVLITGFYILFKQNIFSMKLLQILSIVIYFSIGVSLVVCNVPISTAMLKIVDKDKFGKVSSVINIGSQGLTPFAVFLGGIALTYLGSSGLLIICAAGLIVTTLFTTFNKPINEL